MLVVAGFLIYTWTQKLFTDEIAKWQHYVGLILFIPLIILFFKNFKWSVLLTGVYLITGMFYLFTITPWVTTLNYMKIGPLTISLFNPPMFVVFLLYFFLNFNTLVDIKLDYEEADK
ncbi:MAG: hypothetical protein ABI472_06465 [Ginsengibacter sp.]